MWDGAIAGYNRVRAADDAANLGELQRAGLAQNLVKSAIEQEGAAKTRQRESEFRAKLSQLGDNPTHEQVRALALQSGLVAPKDMLSNDLGMYKADTSKELALSRLAMQQQNHDQQYELAKRKVANAEQAAQLDAWYKSGNMAIRTAMAKYGLPSDIFDGASIPAAPTAQPAPQPEVLPSGTLAKGVTRSAVSPQDLEAMRVSAPADYAAIMGAQQTPEPTALNTLRGAPAASVASPSPTPAPPPAVLQPKPPVSTLPGAPTPPLSRRAMEQQGKEKLVPVMQDGKVVYVRQSDAVGQEVGSPRTNDQPITKRVQALGQALEKAGISQTDQVVKDAEVAVSDPAILRTLTGFGTLKPDILASKEVTDARQAIKKLFNITLKDRSGAAVTNQELERLKGEFGAGVFKKPEQLKTAVERARQIVDSHYKTISAGYGEDALKAYNDNLKAIGGTPKGSSNSDLFKQADAIINRD